MKVAIYCDSLIGKGGSERVVIELANRLGADIICCGFNNDIENWLPIKNNVYNIGNLSYKFSIPLSFFFEIPIRFLFYKNENYDVNIFFGISSIFAAKKGKGNIWFCFTPNRLLYDLKEWKLENSSFLKRKFFQTHILIFKKIDQNIIKNNVTTIIAQTEHVKERIKKYYKKNSQVIYSPIDTTKYKFNKVGDYFLAVSRLMPEKRMDLIAKAFTKLKNYKLIIVGDGLEKGKIFNIVNGYRNITLLSDVSEEKLIELYSKCFAVIYMPIREDFGLVPLEAMASGKICIAANEGGCKETIVDRKTGYLIKATERNLIKLVKKLDKQHLVKMKKDCIQQSKKFDIKNTIKLWEKSIDLVIKNPNKAPLNLYTNR